MTDYPAKKRVHTSGTKANGQRKFGGLIAVLIFGVLLLIILGSFLKAFVPKQASLGAGWDGKTSLGVVLNTKPVTIVIYSKDSSKIGVFMMPIGLKYATGNADHPIASVNSISSMQGTKAEGIVSGLNGINISRFIYFKDPPMLNQARAYEMFKQFSSIKTPFSIIFGKNMGFSSDLSKMELLNLWWDVKGFTVAQVDIQNVGNFSEDIIGPTDIKFKGIDRESIHREMSKYFDGATYGDVEVINNSGVTGAGSLASNMLSAYGWNVVNVGSTDNIETNCRIVSQDRLRDDAVLLASIFGCNIIQGQNESGGNPVMFLGSNFAKRYF